MNIFDILQFLLFFRIANIHCHGDKSKVLLVHINSQISLSISEIISSKFYISLPLKYSSIESIANGCYQDNANCEPIWVSNQLNNFESALIGWPYQVYNDSIWPSFSAGCSSKFIPVNLKFDQLMRLVTKPKTTLGMMSTDINSSEIPNKFLNNVIKQVVEHKMNLIMIVVQTKNSTFFAIGPKFVQHPKPLAFIRDIDVKNIIVEILDLKISNGNSDGNKTIAHILTVPESHHKKSGLFKIIFLSVIIGISVVIGSLFIIEAVKNACSKKQRINHHYNFGLNDISKNAGFPEKTYLLNLSDEDELFSDAMQHIQTTPTSN